MHALIDFWEADDLEAGTRTSIRLMKMERAPGRIFALSEFELLERVGRMPALSDGMLSTSETAGVVQIFKNQETYDADALKEMWMSNE